MGDGGSVTVRPVSLPLSQSSGIRFLSSPYLPRSRFSKATPAVADFGHALVKTAQAHGHAVEAHKALLPTAHVAARLALLKAVKV